MSTASVQGIRILRARRDEDPAEWVAALGREEWLADARLLKRDAAGSVRRATMLGREVVVKTRGFDGVWARVKSALGRGKGDRHWRGAAMLAAKKVPTARVFVLARAMIDGRVCELLVMEWLEGPTLLGVMAEAGGSVRGQHVLARTVGEQVARMGGLFNRDHKPSNLIVQSGGRIAVIDCEGVRRAGVVGVERMFASLVIEPTGCGVRPRRALLMAALRGYVEAAGAERSAVRELWRGAARVVAHHGDPTPRINPLR